MITALTTLFGSLARMLGALVLATPIAMAGGDDMVIIDAAYNATIEVDGVVVDSQSADTISPTAELLYGEQGGPLFAYSVHQTFVDPGPVLRVLVVTNLNIDNVSQSSVSARVEATFTVEIGSNGSFFIVPKTRLFNTLTGNATGEAWFEITDENGPVFAVPTAPNGTRFFRDRYVYAPAGTYTLRYLAEAEYTPDDNIAGRSEALLGSDYEVRFAPGFVVCGEADLASPFGVLDLSDISTFVANFTRGQEVDLNFDGFYDLADITIFVTSFNNGCP